MAIDHSRSQMHLHIPTHYKRNQGTCNVHANLAQVTTLSLYSYLTYFVKTTEYISETH